jgi:hypothetical protein
LLIGIHCDEVRRSWRVASADHVGNYSLTEALKYPANFCECPLLRLSATKGSLSDISIFSLGTLHCGAP